MFTCSQALCCLRHGQPGQQTVRWCETKQREGSDWIYRLARLPSSPKKAEDLGLGLKRRVESSAVGQHKSCWTEEERTSITRCSLFFKTHISCIFWLGPTALRLARRINQGLHVCSPAGRLSKTHACTKINKLRRAWKRLNRRRSSWNFTQLLTQPINGASKYSGDLKICLNKQPLPEKRLILPITGCKAQSQALKTESQTFRAPKWTR